MKIKDALYHPALSNYLHLIRENIRLQKREFVYEEVVCSSEPIESVMLHTFVWEDSVEGEVFWVRAYNEVASYDANNLLNE